MKHELLDVQAGFRKGRGTRDQIVNIRWIIEKAREFQKNIYFLFIGYSKAFDYVDHNKQGKILKEIRIQDRLFCLVDYAKAFDCVDHNKLWKILKEMGIPNNLTCLLRNLYVGQEATVRTGHGTTDWFQIRKRISRLYIVTLFI